MDIAVSKSDREMRALIPDNVLEEYNIIFIPVPDIQEHHLTKLDFQTLPDIQLLNAEIREDFIKPCILKGEGDSPLILMDKLGNHDLFSMMLVHGDRFPIKGFGDLSFFEIETMFEIYQKFIEFWEQVPNRIEYSPRFSFNHDPYTVDRLGLQSIEQFHAHFYFFRVANLEQYTSTHSFVLRELLNNSDYKDYYDPGSFPLEKMLLDLNKNCLKVPHKLELIDESLFEKVVARRGLGLNMLYEGDVNYFRQPVFIEYLMEQQLKMERVLCEFTNSVLVNNQNKGGLVISIERAVWFIESLPWLSPSTKTLLIEFVSLLRSIPARVYRWLTQRSISKNIFAYRNWCYSFSIDIRNKNPSQFLLNFCPRVFSEIGGAGLFAMENYNAVVIDRKKDLFFEDTQIAIRRQWQQDFLSRVYADHE